MLKLGERFINPDHIVAVQWQTLFPLPDEVLRVHTSAIVPPYHDDQRFAEGLAIDLDGEEADALLAWLDTQATDLLAWQRERQRVYGDTASKAFCERDGHAFGLDWYCTRPGCAAFKCDWEAQEAAKERERNLAAVRKVASIYEGREHP